MGIAETEKIAAHDPADHKNPRLRHRASIKRPGISYSNRRRFIRRLKNREEPIVKKWHHRFNSIRVWILLLLVTIAVVHMCLNTSVVAFLKHRYISHYQDMIHNKANYCCHSFTSMEMFDHIRGNVLNQEDALNRLEASLNNSGTFQSITLVGSSGIGKTLTARNLLQTFPWSDNAHYLAWNDHQLLSEYARLQKVKSLLENFNHCGRNLLIIDNLSASDTRHISTINDMILSADQDEMDVKHVFVIYIINLNRLLADAEYERRLASLQDLNGTTVITYRSFGPSDVEKCLRHEANISAFDLEERHILEIVNTFNATIVGCKAAQSKVHMYGSPRPILQDKADLDQDQINQLKN